MIETLYGLDRLDSLQAFLLSLLVGLAFGFALERGGLGSSRKLAGVFYFRDMTVVKVLFTAVITAMLGLIYVEHLGWISPEQVYRMPTIYGAQVVGGLLFGVGFVTAGWCPGTAAVGTASGKVDAPVFLGGTILGSILFNELFPVLKPLYAWGDYGTSLVYEVLGVSRTAFAVFFALLAVACFWAAETLEKRRSGPAYIPRKAFVVVFSAALALAAAGLLVTPQRVSVAGTDRVPPSAETVLLQAVEEGLDHVEPEALARRMTAGEPGLLVVDVRPEAEFARFHLRGAVNVPVSGLPGFLEPRRHQGTVVLYSNGMTHPAQARDALSRLGHGNVFILTDGLTGFLERCLKPASLREAPVPPAEAERILAWRAYFAEPDAPPAAPPERVPVPETGLPGMVGPDWLAGHLGKAGLSVIDVRDQKAYNGGHIPGALSLNPESVRGNVRGLPSVLLPADVLAAHVSLMGITPSDIVVLVCAGEQVRDATLVGMALERLGHRSWGILEGGYEMWVSKGKPVDTRLPDLSLSTYPAEMKTDDFTVDADTVLAESKRGAVILDVRPADYYTGAKKDEARGGHIPGAVNRDFSMDLAAPGSGAVFKPLQELEAAYTALIPGKNTPVIVHCRTGHQASQTYFLLRHLLGYGKVRWYDAGWTDWAARPELPVVP